MTSAQRGSLVTLGLFAVLLVLILSKVKAHSLITDRVDREQILVTASLVPTEPPGPGYTPTPTATRLLDAPYNSYVQPIYKPEATPTPTQVPGTATFAPPLPTEPPPPTQEGDPTGTVAPPPTVSPTPTLEGGPTATVAPPPTVLPTEEPG